MDRERTEFIMREVHITGEYGVSATRTRTSAKHASITIKVDVKTENKSKQSQSMTFDVSTHGDGYEMLAREVSDVLDDICDDMCTLPKVDSK